MREDEKLTPLRQESEKSAPVKSDSLIIASDRSAFRAIARTREV